jgi:hypothetical protein
MVGTGMTRPTGFEVLNRRREMLRLHRLGVEPREFIPSIAAQYSAKVDAVRKDWSNRTKWMKVYLRMEEAQSLVSELLLNYDIAHEEALLLVNEEKNPRAKAQLLYLLFRILDKKTEIMRELGAFEILRCDYKNQAREHARQLLEEEFPWMKGNKDLINTKMALAKASGKCKIEELVELEKKIASAP